MHHSEPDISPTISTEWDDNANEHIVTIELNRVISGVALTLPADQPRDSGTTDGSGIDLTADALLIFYTLPDDADIDAQELSLSDAPGLPEEAQESTPQVECSEAQFNRVVYRSPTLTRALRVAGEAVDCLNQYGGLHAMPDIRGQKAATLIESASGVIEATYIPQARQLNVRQTTLTSSQYELATWLCGLSEEWWSLDHHREHGLVLDIEYRVGEVAPPVPAERSWDDARSEILETDISNRATVAHVAGLWDEYTGEVAIVDKETEPRIAGTEAYVYHIYYAAEVLEKSPAEICEDIYQRLTVEDVEIALAFAREQPAAAEAYIDRRLAGLPNVESRDDLPRDISENFVPLEGSSEAETDGESGGQADE